MHDEARFDERRASADLTNFRLERIEKAQENMVHKDDFEKLAQRLDAVDGRLWALIVLVIFSIIVPIALHYGGSPHAGS